MTITTLIGYSDHFPFTPMTQFAGSVSWTDRFVNRYIAGADGVPIPFHEFGIRRAELTGQLRHYEGDPDFLLSLLAAAHAQFHPDESPFDQLMLVEETYRVVDGRPGPATTRVIAVWRAP